MKHVFKIMGRYTLTRILLFPKKTTQRKMQQQMEGKGFELTTPDRMMGIQIKFLKGFEDKRKGHGKYIMSFLPEINILLTLDQSSFPW